MAEAPVGNPPPKMTEEQLQFVTFIHQHHSLTGELMSQEYAGKEYGFSPPKYQRYMNLEVVKAALQERGIELARYIDQPDENKWLSSSLTPDQLLVANTMLDLIDTRSEKKKLQDLGISTSKYQQWLKDPVFSTYLRERAESMIAGELQHDALLALGDKVRSGDINAIKYYHEFTNRFIPVANRGAGTNGATADIQGLLVRIIEIITDEVDDPLAITRIADRFKTLMTARTIAGQLIDESEPILIPEISQARVLTPKMQELLEKGEGVNS